MNSPQFQKSIFSLKSLLFTPATKSDRFARAADVQADGLIIDLEDAVAPSAKDEARTAALRYLEKIPAEHLPCALRINSPETRFGLDDLQALLISSANLLVVNRQGIGSFDGQMVDEAVARKARLVLERAGMTPQD